MVTKPQRDKKRLNDKWGTYRVFISYARTEFDKAKQVCGFLKKNGINPIWDQNFAYGHGFHDQIKNFIQHAHVFMPLITKESSERGWVHQEIGYALGLNVPVLPVCFHPSQEKLQEARQVPDKIAPGQFLAQLQPIELVEPIKNGVNVFSPVVLANLVTRYANPVFARYRCSDQREERAIEIARFAEEAFFTQQALRLEGTGHVRQRGALSSFHIPDRVITDNVWRDRYERRFENGSTLDEEILAEELWEHFVERGGPTPYHRKVQRMERMALHKHARESGCSLIINPYMKFKPFTTRARIVRLQCLVNFLRQSEQFEQPVVVAIKPQMDDGLNTTLVGDWFAAVSITMTGPRQTNFTTHAPSIQTRIDLFETEFEQQLRSRGWDRQGSRQSAIEEIEWIISELQAGREPDPPTENATNRERRRAKREDSGPRRRRKNHGVRGDARHQGDR